MQIIEKISNVRQEIDYQRKNNKTIALIPTMGYLHAGHLSLVQTAKKNADFVVMSIFINKKQFNDQNDYNSYPTNINDDIEKAKQAGVDLIFLPTDNEMYQNSLTWVDQKESTEHLCGAFRPGHFRGVFTVVTKLFNIVQPEIAVFGQKDIQQALCLHKMILDLNFPIKLIISPTIREFDGLALSSRNIHLTTTERKQALGIYKTLHKAKEIIADNGLEDISTFLELLKKEISFSEPTSIDYISLVDYDHLQPIVKFEKKAVLAIAANYGETRLIDNMIIEKDKNGEIKCHF